MPTDLVIQQPDFLRQYDPLDQIPPALARKYGVGMAYPPALVLGTSWAIAAGTAKIKMAIYIILATPIGTRLMRPDFGSMLTYLIFSPISDAFVRDVIFHVRTALKTWEPRIDVTQVAVDQSEIEENVLQVTIEYVIKGVGTKDSFVLTVDRSAELPFRPPQEFTVDGQQIQF